MQDCCLLLILLCFLRAFGAGGSRDRVPVGDTLILRNEFFEAVNLRLGDDARML